MLTTALGQSWEVAKLLFQHFLGPNSVSVTESNSMCRVRNKNAILWEWWQHTEWAGRAPNHPQNHIILVVLLFFLVVLGCDVKMREVALGTPDYLHLHWHTVLCVITNNPVTFFFWKSAKKKIKQSGLHRNLLHVFSKISFLRKISQPPRWQKTKIFYISKASFIQDQRTTSTIILRILLWNRSTKRSAIKCILSLSNLIYFLYKMLVTVHLSRQMRTIG